MSDDMARVTKVRVTGDAILRVRFAGDRRERELDLTGLIARSVHFAPLAWISTEANPANATFA